MSTARETEIQRLIVRLVGDMSMYQKMLNDAAKITGSKMKQIGDTVSKTGKSLSKKLTLPIVGGFGAALKLSVDLNKEMANIQSLGLDQKRVEELKKDVQSIAVEVGKGTGDIAGGLYQVVSAFGDSAESAQLLAINAKAATAGLATTEEAIALTSAVTKGYGDTSAEAVQKVADLAFQTVKLGQTTFPELASSIGKVTPLAKELGVTQEELFGSFATLTGVTGNTAEVSTQLRATYQSLIKPTKDMGIALHAIQKELVAQGKSVETDMIKKWEGSAEALKVADAQMQALIKSGKKASSPEIKVLAKQIKDLNKEYDESAKALGKSIVASQGMEQTLKLLGQQAGGDTNILGKMVGSVEAMTAVLSLSGTQSETFNEKLGLMGQAMGAADAAFEAQTNGINRAGFASAQLISKLTVLAQKIGDKLVPFLEMATDWVSKLTEKWEGLSTENQNTILVVGAIIAAIGPLLIILGTLLSAIGSIITALASAQAGIVAVSAAMTAGGTAAVAFNAGIVVLIGSILYLLKLTVELFMEIKKLNAELEKSEQLNDKLGAKRHQQLNTTLEKINKVADAEKRRGLIAAELAKNDQEIAAVKNAVSSAQKNVDSFSLGGTLSPFQSKMANQELKEAQNRLLNAESRGRKLQQALSDVNNGGIKSSEAGNGVTTLVSDDEKLAKAKDLRDPDAKTNAKNLNAMSTGINKLVEKQPTEILLQGAI